jgi:hypothetical protein
MEMAPADADCKKSCLVCAEQIAGTALKCIHCESYQDWRRHFGFGATVLSLVVALFAVIGQAAPAIKSLLRDRQVEVSYAVQGVDYRRITILAANDGERTGAISSGMLKIDGGSPILLTLMDGEGVVLLPPRSTAILHYVVMGDIPSLRRSKSACYLAIPITDQGGIKSFDDQSVECDRLKPLLKGD